MARVGQLPVPWNLRYANGPTAEDAPSDGICEDKYGGTISPRTPPDTNWTYCEVPMEMTSKMRMTISARGRIIIVNKQVTEHGSRGTAPERASKRASEFPRRSRAPIKQAETADRSTVLQWTRFRSFHKASEPRGSGFVQTRRSKSS